MIILCAFSGIAVAQVRNVTLSADDVLEQNGFLQFLLPRFSLKTGIRIDRKPPLDDGEITHSSDLILTRDIPLSEFADPVAVFEGDRTVVYIYSSIGNTNDTDHAARVNRFIAWLTSDIGKATINQFQLEGEQIYWAIEDAEATVEVVVFEGNIVTGEALTYTNCGRCHVIGPANRMKGIGSTPSFALLRTFPDWQTRFGAFFTLNPHVSFSQIIDVTEPFDPGLPPAIHPLEITIEELDDILAFVATIEPADLGAPIVTK